MSKKNVSFVFNPNGAKSCATCKYLLDANLEDEIICSLTKIVVENTLTGEGNETARGLCDKWERLA